MPTTLTQQQTKVDSLAPQLQSLYDEFEDAIDTADQLFGSLTEDQYFHRPSKSWSVGEVMGHLMVTGNAYLEKISKAEQDGRAKQITGNPPYKSGVFSSWFIQFLEPPYKVKAKAPKSFTTEEPPPFTTVRSNYCDLQRRFQKAITDAADLDVGRIIVPSPLTSLLKFPYWQAIGVMAAHQRRHFWQIEQILQKS